MQNRRDIDIDFIGNGVQKGIYRVDFGDSLILAAAASTREKDRLLPEYNLLHVLFANGHSFFPQPYAHYSSQRKDLGELMLMECMPHVDLDVFKQEQSHIPDFPRRLAYAIGKAVATVGYYTGRYSSEPHNGNILIQRTGDGFELKFCDAIQFKIGGIEAAIEAIMVNRDERPECFRQIKQFRDGLLDGLEEVTGRTKEDLMQELNKILRRYNPIF